MKTNRPHGQAHKSSWATWFDRGTHWESRSNYRLILWLNPFRLKIAFWRLRMWYGQD